MLSKGGIINICLSIIARNEESCKKCIDFLEEKNKYTFLECRFLPYLSLSFCNSARYCYYYYFLKQIFFKMVEHFEVSLLYSILFASFIHTNKPHYNHTCYMLLQNLPLSCSAPIPFRAPYPKFQPLRRS